MKPVLILVMSLILAQPGKTEAQHTPQTVQDTSRAMKHKFQTREIREPLMPVPGLKPDTFGYYNQIYYKAIKRAEYQNRGAEDRRNPLSDDPKAIPNPRVPEQRVLYPDTMK